MLEILLRSGNVVHYHDDEYTEYKYDGKYFIVIYEVQWIGMYNLDCIEYVEVYKEEQEPDPEPEKPKPAPKSKKKSTQKPVDDGKIKALRQAGWSVAKIADEMKLSDPTVRAHLKKMGVK